VATGRHHLDAMTIVKELGFPVYLVTSNGARIHAPDQELLYAINMKSESIASVLALDIDPEITTVLFRENVWQTSKTNHKLNSFQKEMTYPPQVVNFDSLEDYSAIKLFFTHDNHQKLVDLKEQILMQHPEEFSHAFSLPICLEFMDKSVDKSVAIAKILALEGRTLEEAISFGDGFNDEKMLLSTGKALIMGNAPESLKNKLAHLDVILANDEDGVANYLTKYIFNKQQ
jgi:Cof subfamily protein (haloacid dehalogenase superfamily)